MSMSNCSPLRAFALLLFLSFTQGVVTQHAAAGVLGDKIDVIISSEVMHDDNLFRTADSEESDTRLRLGAALEGDLDFGRQNIKFGAKVHRNRFSDFDNLDYTGHAADLAWDWAVSERFSGSVWGGLSEDLSDFDEFLTNTRDKIERDEIGAEFGYNVSRRFRLETSVKRNSFEHTLDSRERSNETTREAELAALYRSPGGSFFGVIASRVDGEYPDRDFIAGVSSIDDGYEQDRFGATVRLNPSAKTSLRLDLGRTEREQDNISGRDFSEPWWRLEASWDRSSRLSLRFISEQDIRSIDNDDSSFVTYTSYAFQPAWTVNSRLRLTGSIRYQEIDFSENVGSSLVGREDDQLQFAISGQYKVRDWLRWRVTTDWGDRDSSDPRFERSFWRFSTALELVF